MLHLKSGRGEGESRGERGGRGGYQVGVPAFTPLLCAASCLCNMWLNNDSFLSRTYVYRVSTAATGAAEATREGQEDGRRERGAEGAAEGGQSVIRGETWHTLGRLRHGICSGLRACVSLHGY